MPRKHSWPSCNLIRRYVTSKFGTVLLNNLGINVYLVSDLIWTLVHSCCMSDSSPAVPFLGLLMATLSRVSPVLWENDPEPVPCDATYGPPSINSNSCPDAYDQVSVNTTVGVSDRCHLVKLWSTSINRRLIDYQEAPLYFRFPFTFFFLLFCLLSFH